MGFEAICRAALLSQYNSIGSSTGALSSCNRPCTQTNSATVVAILMYSASAELLETVLCFFDFQEIKEFPNLMQYPVTDFLESIQDAQSASQKAVTLLDDVLLINRPIPGLSLMYLTTRSAAS